jgi:hypothetical protein
MYNIPVIHNNVLRYVNDVFASSNHKGYTYSVKLSNGEVVDIGECELIINIDEYRKVVKIFLDSEKKQLNS